MFANQKNQVFNEAMRAGRTRFNEAVLLSRQEGLRTAIRMMRDGVPFYFLPDMDLGPRDSVFVPFFGVPAATVTSVARLAQMTKAVVVPCVTEMTDDGLRRAALSRVGRLSGRRPGGRHCPRMNQFIEARALEMPAQYLWTHKRFKTRPPGERGFYGRSGDTRCSMAGQEAAE